MKREEKSFATGARSAFGPRGLSLRAHISLAVAIVALLSVALICLLSNILLEKQFEHYAGEQRELRADDIAQNLSMLYYPVTKTWDVDALHALGMYSMTDGYILLVEDADGAVVWDAQNHDMARCSEIMTEIAARMERYGRGGGFSARSIPLLQDDRFVGTARVSSYGPFFFSEADAALLGALNRILLIVGIVALAAAALVGFALARRAARPALEAARATQRIAGGDFAARIGTDSGVRELDDLARTMNRLAEDLGKQHELRKRLTADMAHELRTPLAAVSVQIESMAEGAVPPTPERLAGCRDEIRRLTKLVTELERLEEADAGDDAGHREDTDIAALTRSVCAAWESEAAAKDVTLDVRKAGEGPAIAKVDGDSVAGAISNLLSNAIKYTPRGGRVSVEIVSGDPDTPGVDDPAAPTVGDHKARGAGRVSVIVRDTGPGVPGDELPYIFERLYRADRSRNRGTGGAGLGLAIAREAARANGGEITAANAPDGGAVFTISL